MDLARGSGPCFSWMHRHCNAASDASNSRSKTASSENPLSRVLALTPAEERSISSTLRNHYSYYEHLYYYYYYHHFLSSSLSSEWLACLSPQVGSPYLMTLDSGCFGEVDATVSMLTFDACKSAPSQIQFQGLKSYIQLH